MKEELSTYVMILAVGITLACVEHVHSHSATMLKSHGSIQYTLNNELTSMLTALQVKHKQKCKQNQLQGLEQQTLSKQEQ